MSSKIEIQRICQLCGIEFTAKTTVTKYCSHKCASKAYKLRKKEEKIIKSNQKTNEQKILSASDLKLEEIKQKDFLSIKEASKLLGVSDRTFYRLMKNGTINFKKLGNRTIIPRIEINKLFEL